MKSSDNHLVIMAGGIGSRFWPVSTTDNPKQFLDILGVGRSMLQLTLDRFNGIVPPENVWVVTGAAFAEKVREQLPQIPSGNVLLEPCGRGTAPCIAYVSWKIKVHHPHANIIVVPSDHSIKDVETFQTAVRETLSYVSETDAIITLGMKPDHPATGYGYILADLSCAALRQQHLYRVDTFQEKPNRETAEGYIRQNNCYWNAGIFVWNVSTIINAFRIYCPEVGDVFEALQSVYYTPEEQTRINEVFPSCPKTSVDYAIMEKAEEVFVYPVDFGWSDVGTWKSLYQQLPKDQHGNAVVGENVHVVESENCIIHTTTCQEVVVQGLDGCIVVEKDGRLLIAKMTEEQRISSFH